MAICQLWLVKFLTPGLVVLAAGFTLLTVAVLCCEAEPLVRARRKFRALPRLQQVLLVLALGVMTVSAQKSGTNGVFNAEIAEEGRRGVAVATQGGGGVSAPSNLSNLRVENSQAETNVFALTSFSLDRANCAVLFTAAWTSNFFDSVDSRNVDLFSSTNLLERRWTSLGALAVPSDTNACAFVVTSNDVSAAVRPQFLDTFAGLGFFRFGLDLDVDGDGLTDAYESFCSLTDPTLADTDGDGLGDGRELQVGTDPFVSDSDDDGVCDGDEVAVGANPRLGDSDSDGLSDAVEIGTMSALSEEGFMWFDMSDGTRLITRQTADGDSWSVSVPGGCTINNVCYTNAKVRVDGTVHLLCPTNATSWNSACVYGTLSNSQYSACHVTIALCGSDLYARTNDWGSQILHGVVQAEDRKCTVIEYRNVGLYTCRNTNETLTCQLILPQDETNVVYVSYLCASNAFYEANLIAGVQCGGMKSFKTGQRYYNLTWPQSDDFPQDRLTIKYMIGTGSDPASADTDADGLSDFAEASIYRTNPLVADTDGDGLDDGREVAIGTNPLVRDSDGDGMSDSWEVQQNLDPLTDDSAADPDGDGLSNLSECELGTSPTSSDSDGDGLSDAAEVDLGSDPLCVDTDDDGLDDGTEAEIGTSARDADTDLDGLTDAWEHANGLDPLSAAGDAGSDGDPDGDSLSNAKEMEYATDPLTADTDSDALVDGQETGSVFATNAIPWLAFDAGEDLTSVIATNSLRCVNRSLPTLLRIQGEVVTNLTISANGLVFLNKAGYANTGNSTSGASFKYAIDKNALVLAPYLQYAYIRSDVVDRQTAIKYGTATHNGMGYLLVEWLNSYYNTSTWQTNSISFQLAIPTNAPDRAYARYRDVTGQYMDGQYASVGMQTFDGRWLHSWCYRSAGRVSDGLSIEFLFGTNSDPLVADTDSDGIADGQEVVIGTSLNDADTDGDGLLDAWEVANGLNPLSSAGDDGASGDVDGDGLANLQEQECGGNPRSVDTDGDGLSDARELQLGTSVSLADSDHDGLLDGLENTLGINPLQPDSDGDGMNDGWEYENRDAGFSPAVNNANDENPNNDIGADPDGDGLSNGEECTWGTNPSNADSDGDGATDGTEIGQNSDPTDSSDEGRPNTRISVSFTFGDPSGSHSEKYRLEITPVSGVGERPAAISWLNENYGECETKTAMMKAGWKYEVRFYHAGTNGSGGGYPDYDYELDCSRDSLPNNVVPDDSSSLFGTDYTSDSFAAEGKVATITVYAVTGVTICDPDDASWKELDAGRVVLDDERLRIKVEVAPRVESLSQCRLLFGDSVTVKTSGTCPSGAVVILPDDANLVHFSDRSEIRFAKTSDQLKDLGLLPADGNGEDGVNEMASVDIVQTEGQSLADSEAFAGLGYASRGKATLDTAKTLDSTPPNSRPSDSFFKAAGCEIVTAEFGGATSSRRQIMNQADYFYFSGHGEHYSNVIHNGDGNNGIGPSTVKDYWGRDLDCVIIAGCSVLDINDYNNHFPDASHTLSPGKVWERTGPQRFLGYAAQAPGDAGGAPTRIINSWVSNRGTLGDVNAWMKANADNRAWNACVIVKDEKFLYFTRKWFRHVVVEKTKEEW